MIPVFDKDLHTYVDPYDNTKFQSVTQWINLYKKPFDKLNMASRIAKRQGVAIDEVLADWDKKRTDSTTFGTSIHKILETYFLNEKITTENRQVVESFNMLGIHFHKKHTFFEKIVFDKKIGIAGTADVIEHVGKNMFNVYDFKTNKNFRIASKYNDQMLVPFQDLPNTEYFVYSLQLSMYALLYERMTGKTPCRLRVFWFDRHNNSDYSHHFGKWKSFSMPYLKEDILSCLNMENFF